MTNTMKTCQCCSKAFMSSGERICEPCDTIMCGGAIETENEPAEVLTIDEARKVLTKRHPQMTRAKAKNIKMFGLDGRYNISPEYTQVKIDHYTEIARKIRLGIAC